MTAHQLSAAIPWLGSLPAHLTAQLDLAELAVPAGRLATIRVELEQVLDAYVMTYTLQPPAPGRLQLCQLIEPATLTVAGLATLHAAETRFDGVVLCAYARPLRLRPFQHHVRGRGLPSPPDREAQQRHHLRQPRQLLVEHLRVRARDP